MHSRSQFTIFCLFFGKKIPGCMHSNMFKRHQSFPEFSFILLISFSCVLFLSAVTFNSRALSPAPWPLESHLHFKSLLLRRGKFHQRKPFWQMWTALREVGSLNFSPIWIFFSCTKNQNSFFSSNEWSPQAVFLFAQTPVDKSFPPGSIIKI